MSGTHWHVLGAGAMGCLFSGALLNGGAAITLIGREKNSPSSVSVRIADQHSDREFTLPFFSAREGNTISHLLVTTKAHQARAAVASVAPYLAQDCQLLLLVNGMGLAQQIKEDLPTADIYCGTTTQGAFRIKAHHIEHAGRGATRIGQQGRPEPPLWFDAWSAGIADCSWDADIDTALWQKLAVNCVINPLTATNNCLNGELASRADLAAQVEQLCEEVASICAAAGFQEIARGLHEQVLKVIRGTARNRSSMLQDVQNQKTTEIDSITGHLLSVAAQYAIDAPMNTALLHKVQSYAV